MTWTVPTIKTNASARRAKRTYGLAQWTNFNPRRPCRHRNTWILAGGSGEWCYVCGAYRGLSAWSGEIAHWPRTVWITPTGSPENNPADQLKRKVRKPKGRK